MTDALTAPFSVAAIVLAVAGAAKLRSPAIAVQALRAVGLPGRGWAVRCIACAELCLAMWCLLFPGPVSACALACAYGLFSIVAIALMRSRAACGCFGESEAPASVMHVGVSAAIAVIAAVAAAWPPHAIGWVLARPPMVAAVLMIAIAGSAYATVLAYTELPQAWAAWSAR